MKVSIAFDLSVNGVGNYFTLDDTTKGVLNNTTFVLGGPVLVDVTNRVRSVQINRGRSRQLQRFTAGAANVVMDNRDRYLDPLYSSSPYFGSIVPGKQIVIEDNNLPVYTGQVVDWNLDYSVDGDSIATASCADGLSTISQAVAVAGTATPQLTGARINQVLTDAGWPVAQRTISAGQETLAADVVATGTNSVTYLQKAVDSDPGILFVGKTGLMTFKDRADLQGFTSNVQFGPGGGIPFTNIEVEYGSEELFTIVNVSYWGGTAVATVTASNATGVAAYGEIALNQDTLLATSDDASILATFLSNKWGVPTYRFSALTVSITGVQSNQANQVLGLELGDMVLVNWTPNNIGSPISQYCTIEGITHEVTPENHYVTLNLSKTFASFLLDSSAFGVLDQNNLGF